MIDVARAAAEFHAQDELVHLERALPEVRLADLRREAERLEPQATRVHVPLVRRGGTVGGRRLQREAPAMTALYRELRDVVAALAGRALFLKDADDDHALALYSYRAGDFMRPHLDRCGCAPFASYSLTVGIVDDSSSRLECSLSGGRQLAFATGPGSFTIYNGTRVRHGVSRLGPGERRIVLSGSYRAGPRADRLRHLVQEVWDGLVYFGWRARR